MKLLFSISSIYVWALFAISLKAQQMPVDTLVLLKQLEVKDSRWQAFSPGIKKEAMDTLYLISSKPATLDGLLQMQSRAVIRQYGPGMLATSSIRGASANHTAVIWNGFNLQSATHGTFDLSLLPVEFIDEASVSPGTSSNIWGSGAVGGTINLSNKPHQKEGLGGSATSIMGSFGEYQQFGNLTYGTSRFRSSLKAFYKKADNDFTFNNLALEGRPKQSQKNNHIEQKGLLQENYLFLNKGSQLKLIAWLQATQRQIPPTMAQATSNARQADNFMRVSGEYSKKGNNGSLYVRQAYFFEDVTFKDEPAAIYSSTLLHTSITESEYSMVLPFKLSFNGGLNHTFAAAIADGYNDRVSTSRPAVFFALKKSGKKDNWLVTLSGRQELNDGKLSPFIPFAGAEVGITEKLLLKGNISRSFRLPTLNDLYWKPGGNASLLPETGWSQEAGLRYATALRKFELEAEATAYNRNMDNWIIWLPDGQFWTPQNIMKVWSRGTETSFKTRYHYRKLRFQWDLMANYTLSTNEASKTANDASIGKQLIYMPMYNGNSNFSISYKSLIFIYSYSYTGYRYLTTDHSEYLEPFSLSNIFFSKAFKAKKQDLNFFARINNLLNIQYQVMAFRPMPGRNFQIGLTLNLNK
jgi:vitamin B12 transporter